MLRRCRLRCKGDMVMNFLHDGNPQYGAPYNTYDRRMREDEFDDFMKSVKGWEVLESGAIRRTFNFADYNLAYDFMGRVLAFGYMADRYPRVHWDKLDVTATIYSGKFKGVSLREARLAAFMNDQWFLIKKANEQRDNLIAAHGAQAEGVGVAVSEVRHPERSRDGGPN